MDPAIGTPSEAIVICTRDRPDELRRTLASIAAHPPDIDLLLVVVDASDPEARTRNRTLVGAFEPLPSAHWPYPKDPSLTGQRNYALDHLPSSVDIVHFIDDDVTVHADYFEVLSNVLRTHPRIGGAGGVIIESPMGPPSPWRERLKRLFFLSHTEKGRVLPSGCTTTAQSPSTEDDAALRDTEWLSGCSSSYRRSLLERHRFDETLSGYSMLEDLDLSYRIRQEARLVVHPNACLRHRRASGGRPDTEQYAYTETVHRRWFVERHFDGVGERWAYWWSRVGRFLAVARLPRSDRMDTLRGLGRGLWTVLTRDHPLLSP